MRICIDLDKCYMSGECCYNHPDLFELGEDGYPRIKVAEISDETLILEAEQAVEVCPAGAISVQ